MAFRIYPKPAFIDSIGGGETEAERTYHWGAVETSIEAVVRNGIMATAPPFFLSDAGVMYRGDIKIEQTFWDQWNIDVQYLLRPTGDPSGILDFDNLGGSQWQYNSKATTQSYPVDSPSLHQSQHVTKDGPQGREVVVPQGRRNYQVTYPPGVVTEDYVTYLEGLIGTTNAEVWRSKARGEAMSIGSRGRASNDHQTTVTYNFATGKNLAGMTIGDIADVDKRAFERLNIQFHEDVESAGGADYPIWKPQFVHVERDYDELNFTSAFGF